MQAWLGRGADREGMASAAEYRGDGTVPSHITPALGQPPFIFSRDDWTPTLTAQCSNHCVTYILPLGLRELGGEKRAG